MKRADRIKALEKRVAELEKKLLAFSGFPVQVPCYTIPIKLDPHPQYPIPGPSLPDRRFEVTCHDPRNPLPSVS